MAEATSSSNTLENRSSSEPERRSSLLSAAIEEALRGKSSEELYDYRPGTRMLGITFIITGVIAEKMYGSLRRYARSRTFGYGLNTFEDVVQESLLGFMTSYQDKVPKFIGAPEKLVFAIAANKIADSRRKITRNRAQPTDDLAAFDAILAGRDAGHENIANRGLLEEAAFTALNSLDGKMKVIAAHMMLDPTISGRDLAPMLDTSEGAVRVAKNRTLNHMRRVVATLCAQNPTDEDAQGLQKLLDSFEGKKRKGKKAE